MASSDKIKNYDNSYGFGLPQDIRRGNPLPLDHSAVQVGLANAKTYASSDPSAYVGQILAVIDTEKKEVTTTKPVLDSDNNQVYEDDGVTPKTEEVTEEVDVETVTAYIIKDALGTLEALASSASTGDISTDLATLSTKVAALELKYNTFIGSNTDTLDANLTNTLNDAKTYTDTIVGDVPKTSADVDIYTEQTSGAYDSSKVYYTTYDDGEHYVEISSFADDTTTVSDIFTSLINASATYSSVEYSGVYTKSTETKDIDQTAVQYIDAQITKVSSDSAIDVSVAETAEDGALKTYVIKQGDNEFKINLAKDYLVKSGSTVEYHVNDDSTITETISNTTVAALPTGVEADVRYIKLVINVKEGSATDEAIYLKVTDLVDVYSGVTGTFIDVSVSDDYKISASIVDSSITKAKLATDVTDILDKAESAVQGVKINDVSATVDSDNIANITFTTDDITVGTDTWIMMGGDSEYVPAASGGDGSNS